jgi:hypothetical protein
MGVVRQATGKLNPKATRRADTLIDLMRKHTFK